MHNPDAYIGYHYDGISPEPMTVKQKVRWLNITRHKKSGRPITVDSLFESGRISDFEKEMFGEKKYPRIEISAMTRIKTQDNKEYLSRGMQAIGLSEIGAIVTLPLYDCDFTRKVPISPATTKLPDGTDVKILQVGSGEFSYETSQKIYTTPWSRENVLAALETYPPSEDNDLRGKISYSFQKEGTSNEIGISSLEEFLGDFDEVWTAKTSPTPTISIDNKGLLNYAKLERESREQHKQYS